MKGSVILSLNVIINLLIAFLFIAIHPFSIVPVVIHEYGHYKHLNLLFSLIIQAKITMNSINCHKRNKISSIFTNIISIKG